MGFASLYPSYGLSRRYAPIGHDARVFDAVAKIINSHQHENCDDLDADCAVKVFEAVLAHRGP